MDRERIGCSAKGILLLFLLVFVVIGGVVFALDRVCIAEVSAFLPIYPGAEIQFEQHNFISQFGIGQTVMILTSSEDVSVVQSWYARHTGEISKQRGRNFTRSHGTSWDVSEGQDGTGSQIILSSVCVN